MSKKHVYPFGIIGNCSYMSYIDESANVVWQCWPYFDSSYIFGKLISEKKGGQFSITPAARYSSKQYYLSNTNILVTEFDAQDGSFRVVDFAPRFELYDRYHKPIQLFRKIELLSGAPSIKVVCRPMGEYGEREAEAVVGSNSINFEGLETKVRLTTDIAKTHILNEKEFVLTENKHLVLSWGSPLEAPLKRTFDEFLERTKEYWRNWIRRSSIPAIYQKEVIRSALLLKLHQYEDTGAIIASGTTSLPEYPNHGRNWDYRYCWIRDSYFTLAALTDLGHFTEAERYSHWIQNIVQNENGHFQPVYKIDGSKDIVERELDLEGFQGNQPVRIGNDAYTQIQHDVYGQMLLSLVPLFTDLRVFDHSNPPSLDLVHKCLDKITEVMDSPCAGIWEFRGKMQHHAESYLFHWAGAMGAQKIAKNYNDKKLLEKAQKIQKIASENIEKCYDKANKLYGQSHENKSANASEFLLVTMNYLGHGDVAKDHVKGLEKFLKTEDNLIYRYRDLDDFGETHSTFLICGFWYAEALANIGEVDKAKEVFESLLERSNKLGIFSEDICPQDGSQWGNVAQTYSHVGLINTAFKIASQLDKPNFFDS
ncbi:MAG: glycosyl hydrolase [Peredibacter sp.]|nr:glycosyl hydrolase [Peredibacter sp.]